MRRIGIMIAAALLTACEGPTGPAGPAGAPGVQGPPGAQGPAGSLNRAEITGTFGPTGMFTALLPPAAIANGRIPAIACYVSSDRVVWYALTSFTPSAFTPGCALTGMGTGQAGITIINGIPGSWYYIIAVW